MIDFKRLVEEEDVGVNSKNESGMSALHMAIMGGNLNIAAYALSRACDVNVRDDEGRTPLHLVCIDGDTEGFALLTAKGADIHSRTNEGKTPLHLACWFDHAEIVEFLLEAGADVLAQDDKGRTVLDDEEIDPEIKAMLDAHTPSATARVVPVRVSRPKVLAASGTNVTEEELREGAVGEEVVKEEPVQGQSKRREANWSTSTNVKSFGQPKTAVVDEKRMAASVSSMAQMMTGSSDDMEASMISSMAAMSGSLAKIAATDNPLLKPLDEELDCVRPWQNKPGGPSSISDAALDRMLAQMRENMA